MSRAQELGQTIADLDNRPKAGVMDNAICLRLSLSKPGTTRKIKSDKTVETQQKNLLEETEGTGTLVSVINESINTNLNMIHLSKSIMDCVEYKAIANKDREIAQYLKAKALPSIFMSAVWLIPINSVGEVDHVLVNMKNTREGLVEIMVTRYPEIKAAVKEALGDMSDESDWKKWPTPDALRAAFSMDWEYVAYGANEKLKQISHQLYEREQGKIEQKVAQASDELVWMLRESTQKFMDHAVRRLTTTEKGKSKKLKEDELPKMMEFLDSVKQRNITGDEELERLVEQARALLNGVDTATVIDNAAVRDNLHAGFEQVAQAFNGMLQNRPQRKFRGLEVEEEAVTA